ncbi:hypothetical protein LXA43DRAFT_1097958 [Ganoderma leucocontextum]|nr:hypothetical protein LXA43DRAFT_1097958 [Ganoderma leucocontextum]
MVWWKPPSWYLSPFLDIVAPSSRMLVPVLRALWCTRYPRLFRAATDLHDSASPTCSIGTVHIECVQLLPYSQHHAHLFRFLPLLILILIFFPLILAPADHHPSRILLPFHARILLRHPRLPVIVVVTLVHHRLDLVPGRVLRHRLRVGLRQRIATTPTASQTQTQTQSQNAAAPTAYAKAKMGAAVVAVAVGAIVGL